MNLLWITIVGLSLATFAGLVILSIKLRRQNDRLAGELDSLRRGFHGLCAGAVGVDKRVLRLEQRGRDLEQRQEIVEHRQQGPERPYGEAIQLVQKGAGANRLVEEFGLTRSEADLIVSLHGVQEAG